MPDCWIGSFGITDCICQQLNSLAAGQLSCNWCLACSWWYAFCQQIVILAFIDMEKEYHCDSKSSIFSTGIHLCWHVSYVNIFWLTEAKVTFLGVLSILYSVSFSVFVYQVLFHVALVLTYWRTRRRKCCSCPIFIFKYA